MDVEFRKQIDKHFAKSYDNIINLFSENIRGNHYDTSAPRNFVILCDKDVEKRLVEARLAFMMAFTESNGSLHVTYSTTQFRTALKDVELMYNKSLILGKFGDAVQYVVFAHHIRTQMQRTSFSEEEHYQGLLEIYLKLGKLLFALGEIVDGFIYCLSGCLTCETKVDCTELKLLRHVFETIVASRPSVYQEPSYDKLPHDDTAFIRKLKHLDSEIKYSPEIFKQRVNAFVDIETILNKPKFDESSRRFNNSFEFFVQVDQSNHQRRAGTQGKKEKSAEKGSVKKSSKQGKPSRKTASLAQRMCSATESAMDIDESDGDDDERNQNQRTNSTAFATKNKFGVLLTSSKMVGREEKESTLYNITDDSLVALKVSLGDDSTVGWNDGPWKVASAKGSDEKATEIRCLCDYLKTIYDFSWGCNKLSECRYGERVIVQHCDGDHFNTCPANVLLCHPILEKGDWLVKVRIPCNSPPAYPNGGRSEYRICIHLERNETCKSGDTCEYGHSPEELTIWNTIHDSNVEALPVFSTLKGAKYMPPLLASNQSNLLRSSGSDFQTSASCIPKTLFNPSGRALKQVQNLSAASYSDSNQNQGITLEVVNLISATPLMDSHKFLLACLNCHAITTNEINVTSHRCDRNIVLCREKLDKRTWQRIRPKPPTSSLRPNLIQFSMCRDFPRCPRSLRCTSAHSEIERTLWNRELKEKRTLIPSNFVDYLEHSIVLKSHRSITVPIWKNYVSVWVGCQYCTTVATRGYFQVFKCKHNCAKDIVLCRDDSWHHRFWVVVRPRVENSGLYELCRHVERNDCWQWTSCKFAHSDFEFNLWKLDYRKSRKIDLAKIISDELMFWRSNEINYQVVEPRPTMKVFQQPTPFVPSSARSSFDDGYLTENVERKRKRQSPTESSGGNSEPILSPYRLHYVCGTCYFRYKRIVYRRLGTQNKCDYAREPHDFDNSKRIMIFDDNGKAHDIRPLPVFLVKQQNFKPPSLCKIVTGGNACRREVCHYAHSDLERRCWAFLLRNKKDVADIVTEPMHAEARRPALQSATARNSQPLKASNLELPSSAVWGTTTNSAYVKMEEIKGLQDDALYCFLCDKRYANETKFEEHCCSVEHDEKLDVDQKREWACRPPRSRPPFILCKKHINGENCAYSLSPSNFCSDAHSDDELQEWNERILFLLEEFKRKPNDESKAVSEKMKLAKLKTDSIIDLKSNSNAFNFASIDMNGTPVVTTEEREKKFRWLFTINTDKPLKLVALMDKQFLFYFRLLCPMGSVENSSACDGKAFLENSIDCYYEVTVEFIGSKSLGTFSQEVIFDFGDDVPLIRSCLTVNVGVSEMELKHLSELRDLLTPSEVWTSENTEIHWISKISNHNPLINFTNPSDVVSNLHMKLNEQTYFKTMRKLILAEEMRRQAILSSFRIKADVFLGQNLPSNENDNTISSEDRFVFAQVPLDFELSDEFDISDLLLNDCDHAFVAVPENMAQKTESGKRHVYEVEIVNRRKFNYDGIKKDCIFLCLSASFVSWFRLKPGATVPLEVQFNLSRQTFKPLARCLGILEKKQMAHFIFPNLVSRFSSFFTGKVADEAKSKISQFVYLEHKWRNSDNNDDQVRVIRHVVTCATNKTHWIPPMVIYGPFGTGKTRTLAQAVCTLLSQPHLEHTKILICTQSNTTADLYLKHLETYSNLNTEQLKLLVWRLFPRHAVPDALPPFVKPYVRLNDNKTDFDKLTVEKLKTVRIVISTTSGVSRLVKLMEENPNASFTHVFMDEAAQAMEVEMLQPLCVANNMTCVVVAGDHHQIRPTAYLSEAEELQYSYLERLFKSYDDQEKAKAISDIVKPSCHIPKILFTKNYRCHADILAFLSASFYDGYSLTACATVPENNLKPMYFAMAVGKEQILPGGISYSNANEVDEVLFQVAYFWQNWPDSFGEKDIGIVVGTHAQVNLIKEKLKTSRYPGNRVQVGQTNKMHGKEFKVLIVSTVRGRNLLERPLSQRRKLGFLDDDRLINTAITRARYCVVVVGDPVILCTVGKCKAVWRRYVDYCFEKQSFLPERYTKEQMQTEILIADARSNVASGVDQSVLLLATQAVSQMSAF